MVATTKRIKLLTPAPHAPRQMPRAGPRGKVPAWSLFVFTRTLYQAVVQIEDVGAEKFFLCHRLISCAGLLFPFSIFIFHLYWFLLQ